METIINNSPMIVNKTWREKFQDYLANKQKNELLKKIQNMQFNQQKLDNILSLTEGILR